MSLSDEIARQAEPSLSKKAVMGRIADLLTANGIDIDEVGAIKKVSLYQSVTKDNETGDAKVHDLLGVQITPHWQEGPKWPVIQQGPAIRLPAPKAERKQTDWPNAVIIPDIQFGYFHNQQGELEPIHDEDAIAIALAITKDADPSLVVCVGDNLDLAEMSKYVTTPAYAQTTQATIDRATIFGAELRRAAPNAKIVWLAGNHEERLSRFLLQNASAAFGLRRGNLPDSWPVMSVPFLCRFDEPHIDIEYRPGYPASHVWVTEKLRVIHGDKVHSSGSTSHKYLNAEKVSVVYGHIHRREWAEVTRDDHDGPSTVLAASPGCLARIDGAVPSTKGGVDLWGRPVQRWENWQQGLAVIPHNTETGMFAYEQIAIHHGWAMWRGKEYKAPRP